MELLCSIENCKQKSTILCFVCNKKLCPDHRKEHDEQLHSQLYPFTNQIKQLSNRYYLINTKTLISEFQERLNRWREEAHQAIETFYQEKTEELKRDWPDKLTEPAKLLEQTQTKTDLYIEKKKEINHEKIEQLRDAIGYIEQKIGEMEQKGIDIDIIPISFENNLNTEKEYKIQDIDLINLSSPYRAMACSTQSGAPMAANHRNLLIYEDKNLILIPRDLTTVEQYPWTGGNIYDMCWTEKLDSFILITDKRIVYQIKENPFTCIPIQTIPEEKWWSCTSSEQSLFLTTYGSETHIVQFNLHPSFQKMKYWRSPSTCQSHQTISNINYNNESLALIIVDPMTKTAHLELRSALDLNRLWSSSIDISRISYQPAIHSCLIKHQQWIVIIENTSQIYHFSKYGTLISIYEYQPSLWNAILFPSNILAIRTQQKIFFHKI